MRSLDMNKIKFLILSVIISFSSLSSAATIKSSSQLSDAQIQKNILIYVNQYRAAHGLKALQLNAAMSKEATQHSLDMANHRMSFGHQGFSKRIKHLYAQIGNCRGGAENVAFNYKDIKELVRLWTKSPGHRRNIVGNYNLTGIGVARDTNGKPYYTQIFIRADRVKPVKAG